MKPDTWTRTEDDARRVAYDIGRDEDLSSGPGDQEPNEILKRAEDEYRATHVVEDWPILWTCRACLSDHRFDDDDRCECGRLREDRSA